MNAVLKTPLNLQPYGAAELKATARTFLVRSLALGSAAWTIVFLAAALTLAIFARAPLITIPRVTTIDPMPYALHLDAPHSIARAAPMRRPIETAIPNPQPLAPEEPKEVASNPAGGVPAEPGGAPTRTVADELPAPNDNPAPVDYVYRDVEPNVLERVEPRYPELAILAGQEGLVVIQVLIGRDGNMVRTLVRRSVPMLDEPALEALSHWRFSPALANGHPVAVWITVPFRFHLH